MLSRFKNHPLAKQIEQARHQQFMQEAKPHLIGGIVTGCFIYFIFRDFTSELGTAIWFVCQVFLACCTIAFYHLYKHYPNKLNPNRWSQVILAVSLCWGIVWSLPAFFFIDVPSVEYLATLLLIITAMTISPAPAMVIYPYAYSVFMTLPLAALSYQLFLSDYNNYLVLCIPFFWVTALTYGWQLHKTIIDSICLRLELERAHSEAEQANIAKSNFLAAASHDLRQPLQAIDLFFQALKQKLDIDKGEEFVHKLDNSIDNMSELLNALLDVSKLDADVVQVKAEHIRAQDALAKTLVQYQAIAKEKNLEFVINIGDETLYADPILLDRVIHNLLSNAFRYTHQGSVELCSHIEGEYLVLAVNDSGIGIAESDQNAIFNEFHQLNNPERDKKKGVGLGLAIVKRLADLQDWQLQLESELGRGSCFSLRLPLGDKKQVQPRVTKANTSKPFQQNKLLVIDDDEDIRTALSSLLCSWGCEVEAHASLECALTQLGTTTANKSWQPELIISDFRLRDNRNGIDAIASLRDNFQSDIPAILITGDTAPERLQQAQASGLSVLHKPVKAAQLRQVLQHKLAS